MHHGAGSFVLPDWGRNIRRWALSRWVVAGVISVYCVGLAAGLLIYHLMSTVSTAEVTRTSTWQQLGRIFVITPEGCRTGEFGDSMPTYAVS